MKAVLCIGELLIDFMGSKVDRNLSEQEVFIKKAGGAPANVACTIGALGGKCHLFGAVGNDGFGDFLEATVKAFRVDTFSLQRSSKGTTMAFVSIDHTGERDFVFVRGADAEVRRQNLSDSVFSQCHIIHFGAATGFLEGDLKKTYLDLLYEARESNKFISFDPNYRSAFWEKDQLGFVSEIQPFLEQAHLIKLSEEEALLVAGVLNLEDAVLMLKEKYRGTFAITRGEKGVLLFNSLWELRVPAPVVEVQDTTGAGDAFIGALLYTLSLDDNPQNILLQRERMFDYGQKANDVAAYVCTEFGALTALEKKLKYRQHD